MHLAGVEASISADNTFSSSVRLRGKFNLSLSGTWTATVTVQRSFDDGTIWVDVEDFTENVERVGEEPEVGVLYRFGIKLGNYTSGTVVGRLSQ